MTLFVTGAGGFVGSAVARAALAEGHEVVAAVRPGGNRSRLQDHPALRIVELDHRSREDVQAVMRQHRPSIIVHLAWSGVSSQAQRQRQQVTDNVESSCGLLEAAVDAGVSKFVGIGSQGEYGSRSGRISESDLPEPTTHYGASKLAVLFLTRLLAAQAGVDFAWLRLFATYGPGDNPHWLIPSLIEKMLDGACPKMTEGRQLVDYLYIDDVARGILAVATNRAATGVFNLGSGKPVSVRRIAEEVRDLTAPNLNLVFGDVAYKPDQVWHMEADITRLREATGWQPDIALGDGLAATVDWQRSRRGAMATSR